jgi:hypothetical protein
MFAALSDQDFRVSSPGSLATCTTASITRLTHPGQRERQTQGYKSPVHAYPFLAADGPSAPHFCPRQQR